MKSRAAVPSVKRYYKSQKKKYLLDLSEIDNKMADLEEKRAREVQ